MSDVPNGLNSVAAIKRLHDEEFIKRMDRVFPSTMAGRIEMLHALIMPQPVLDAFGEPMLDEYGEPVMRDPVIKMTADEYIKILELK